MQGLCTDEHLLGHSARVGYTVHAHGSAQVVLAGAAALAASTANQGLDDNAVTFAPRQGICADRLDLRTDLVSGTHGGRGLMAGVPVQIAAADSAAMDCDSYFVFSGRRESDIDDVDVTGADNGQGQTHAVVMSVWRMRRNRRAVRRRLRRMKRGCAEL